MTRGALFLVVLAIFAGAAAGGVAHVLSRSGEAAISPNPDAPAAITNIADLREDMDRMKDQVNRLVQDLGQVTLESQANAERAAQLEAELAMAKENGSPLEGAIAGALQGTQFKFDSGGGRVVALAGVPGHRMSGRFGKTAELMKLTEEERWDKMREDLSLDSYQENELRQIQKDLRADMQKMFRVDPDSGNTTARFDFRKMMETRNKANERAKNLLSEDQYKKFRDDGYASSVGIGGGNHMVSVSTFTTTEEKDK